MTHYIACINNKYFALFDANIKILKYTFLRTVVKNAIVIFFFIWFTLSLKTDEKKATFVDV